MNTDTVLPKNTKFVKLMCGHIVRIIADEYGFITYLDTYGEKITLQGLELTHGLESKYDIIEVYTIDEYPEMYLGEL